MGVTVLTQFPMNENRTGSQTIEILTKRITALGASQQGQFLVDCETYSSVPALETPFGVMPLLEIDGKVLHQSVAIARYVANVVNLVGRNPLENAEIDAAVDTVNDVRMSHQRTVHVLHNSEQPATVFSILETGTKTIPLATDGLFDLLMMKMSTFYQTKKQKAESKGPRYEIGDFCVKLGTVTVSSNFKGILVEVEYRPCTVPALCWDLMQEFMQGFLGSSAPTSPPLYFQNRMQDVCTPIDIIQQYLDHFTMFRKVPGPGMGLRPQ